MSAASSPLSQALPLGAALIAVTMAAAQGVRSTDAAPFDDHASLMRQLGVKSVRPGPNPNDPATFEETNANRLLNTLPDVLTMRNGTKLTRASQWPARRKEILELFEREVYGRVPKNAPKVTWEVTGVSAGEAGGVQTLTRTLVGHVDNRTHPSVKADIRASITVPIHSSGPVPLMLEFGGWRRPGAPSPLSFALAKGWGYGTIDPNSIQPDNARMDLGVIGIANRGKPRKPDQWGALRAWGWGVSRLVDHIERNRELGVDPKKVGIAGVSRFGKAAIVTQAFDPRIAVALVASSGEGGTKLHRRLFGERIENLAGSEFYWMAGNIIKYGSADPEVTVADLPVDSHELIALCAPRPVFLSHGVPEKGDAHWIDARGSFMAGVLAGPVYRMLGARDLATPGNFLTDPMPHVGTLIGGELAWRQHEGGHEIGPNWGPFFEWVGRHIKAPAAVQGGQPYAVPPGVPSPRTDPNSLAAHAQLIEKARTGGIDLYFVGDSITRRWGTSDAAYAAFLTNWRANFFGWNAGNFGWGGDSTRNILWRLKNGELDGVNPKAIVLLAGTNDVGNVPGDAAKVEEVTQGIRAILQTCKEKAPKTTIILTAIFPRNDNPATWPTIRAINANLERMADGRRVRFLNVNSRLADADGKLVEGVTVDGLHLSAKGYQIWADGLKPMLRAILGPPAATDHAPAPTGDPSAARPPGE